MNRRSDQGTERRRLQILRGLAGSRSRGARPESRLPDRDECAIKKRGTLKQCNFLIHSLPIREPEDGYYHWHVEIMPKLTKVAGFEWGTGFYINPTPPEEAAKFLREAGLG